MDSDSKSRDEEKVLIEKKIAKRIRIWIRIRISDSDLDSDSTKMDSDSDSDWKRNLPQKKTFNQSSRLDERNLPQKKPFNQSSRLDERNLPWGFLESLEIPGIPVKNSWGSLESLGFLESLRIPDKNP